MRAIVLALCVLCTPLIGQDSFRLDGDTAYILDGVENLTQIGDTFYSTKVEKIGFKQIGMFRLPEGSKASITVEDVQRNIVDYEYLGKMEAPVLDEDGEETGDTKTFDVYGIKQKGRFFIDAITIVDDKIERKRVVIKVGEGPDPDPIDPDDPDPPSPDDLPIDGDGLRVLMLYEGKNSSFLTPSEREIVFSTRTRDYLTRNAVEWRAFDNDTQFTDPSNIWGKAIAKAGQNDEKPQLLISNGKTGYVGSFPPSSDEFIELVKSFLPMQFRGFDFKNASITMYSTRNCVWCDRWMEREYRKVKDSGIKFDRSYRYPRGVRAFPTFDVVNETGQRFRFVGFKAADTLLQAASK